MHLKVWSIKEERETESLAYTTESNKELSGWVNLCIIKGRGKDIHGQWGSGDEKS